MSRHILKGVGWTVATNTVRCERHIARHLLTSRTDGRLLAAHLSWQVLELIHVRIAHAAVDTRASTGDGARRFFVLCGVASRSTVGAHGIVRHIASRGVVSTNRASVALAILCVHV